MVSRKVIDELYLRCFLGIAKVISFLVVVRVEGVKG
ncbi:MAG: hypothetical protein ACJAUR_000841 [Ulvibacter sp.]|jgi:hypothetical protein